MSASTAALCLGLGSKVVGRQNIKQKCIRYFAAVRNAAGPRFEIIFGGERAIHMGVAGTGWDRLGQAAGRLGKAAGRKE